MTKHFWAALAALLAFGILTLASSTESWAAVAALGAILLAVTVAYFHYRRRLARAVIEPLTPGRDDRVIPQDVKIAVTLRDKGVCQLRYAGCQTDFDLQFDHRYPWSLGGSSKDPDNIQLACGPCNRQKSNKIPVG